MPSSRRGFLAAAGAVSAALAGCVTIDAPARTGEWPTPTGTDARTNRTDRPGPRGALYPAWTAEVAAGAPLATPVVVDGTVYVLQSNRSPAEPRRASVTAHDAASGAVRWETTLLERVADILDVHLDALRWNGDERLLYAQTMDGVHALAPDGTERWFAPLPTVAQPWPDVAAPVVEAGTLVAVAYGERGGEAAPELRGYDPATGGLRWRAEFPDGADPWTPTAADGVVYVPFLDAGAGRRLVAIDAATGSVRWSERLPVAGPVAAADGSLAVPLEEGGADTVARLDPADRAVAWRVPAPRRTDAGMAVADGALFYAADGRLVARELETGARRWAFGEGRRVYQGWTPTVAGEVVYAFAVADGTVSLYGLDVETGAIYASGRVGESTATSALSAVDGAAYLTVAGGEVRCYETCARTAFDRCVLG
jgi:outer membrane protein assembly factor BamB